MTVLKNLTRKEVLANQVEKTSGFFGRMKGLMGKSSFDQNHVLWIPYCNSIHTFFMRFPIDVIFVDKNLIVKSVYKNIKPWRVLWPIWGASSVFEFSSGHLQKTIIEKGDQLYVGP